MIELSVALPLYRSKSIAWLALESLCHQKKPDCDWELVVAEEVKDDPMGQAAIAEYEARLAAAGCAHVSYVGLNEWVPLGRKWAILAQNADKDSRLFFLQSADCWSQPNRLSTGHALVDNGADWIQSIAHVLYDIKTDRLICYDQTFNMLAAGADMAVRTDLLRSLPADADRWRHVDNWLLAHCHQQRWHLNMVLDQTGDWKRSINVHGLNNLSARNHIFDGGVMPGIPPGAFQPMAERLEALVPAEIAARLRSLRPQTENWQRVGEMRKLQGVTCAS